MMDCDTTGIEPDLALVKFKKMVGGGSLQIVNNTVPRALRKLGYTEETIEAIVEHIAQHGNVVDAPGLKPEHESTFDCAMGARTISPMGHVRMMAAAQPFLSGAISKTVNMPETATVEEIEEVYFQGWKLGLKALAIYRDNCKVGQPLSDAKGTSRDNGVKARQRPRLRRSSSTGRPASGCRRTVRRRRRPFTVGGAEGYMTASRYPDDGLGEIFLKMSKQGSTLAGMMDAFSIAVSIGLQYGVPLETYVKKFVNMRFDPAGLTDDADVRMAQSIMDYIFRRLALDYLPYDSRAGLGIYTADERTQVRRDRLLRAGRGAGVGRGRGGRRRARDARAVGAGHRGSSGRGDRGGTGCCCGDLGALVDRAARGAAGHRIGRTDVLHLRHQDAAGRFVLRLRRVRRHQRLQLIGVTPNQSVEDPGRNRGRDPQRREV